MFRKYTTNRMKELAKKVAFRYLGLGKPDYPYMLDPIQLSFLITKIDELFQTYERPLKIYEIGVARGMTTAFLAQHIMAENLPHQIICIDTFGGFTSSHLDFEITKRNKAKNELLGFAYNDYETWKKNFEKINCVKAIKCDAASYKPTKKSNVDIVLSDVDLYLPTLAILNNFYPCLSESGVMLVDDVKSESCWDGAHEAYHEFCDQTGLKPELLGRKSGIVRKAKSSGHTKFFGEIYG